MRITNNISFASVLLIGILMFFSYGCIVKYEPEGIESVRDLLIVDGTITNDTSLFKLGRSVALDEFLTGDESVDNASLFVETEDGTRFQSEFRGRGVYAVPMGQLNEQTRYRLRISIDGDEYESSFLSPLITPPIDSLSATKKEKGAPVYMCVSTHDSENQSHYYRWTYKEHWEVKAELQANAGWIDPDELEWFSMLTSRNTYYCWAQDTSKIMLLGSSEKLAENIISQKRLVEIAPDHDKLSILYYLAVEQTMLRKEAYDYLNNLQKNVEQTGSIFSPVPSEMKGNIRCTTNPELPVIGYIEVATTTKEKRFFPETMGLYEPPIAACYLSVTTDPRQAPPVFGYYSRETMAPSSYAPWSCVDCRIKSKASKKKPDFWPNTHL